MIRKIKLSVIRTIMKIIAAHRDDYKHVQGQLVIGSTEWKYYQSKLNALTDIEEAIIDEYKLKNK